MDDAKAMVTARQWIKHKPMPSSLDLEFKKNGWNDWLDKVYVRTAELVVENENVTKEVLRHLKQILPSIAFYEILLQKEESKEHALAVFEKYCFIKIKKMAKMIPVFLKIPGLYKRTPVLMKKMLYGIFGSKAGFAFVEKACEDGFAVDMIACPYVEICKKYNCPELAQFFCKSDDYCYGNMHPKLIWGRTKTLGTGGECCDFKLYIKKS